MKNITIGSDPEFGVINFKEEPISVVGLLGGTKNAPLSLGNGCARQEDNVGAELTVPACTSPQEILNYIKYGRARIDEILEPMGLKTIATSSLNYSNKELDSAAARTFGCDPSFDVYTKEESIRPSAKEVGNLRSFGFHVHVGWKGPKSLSTIEALVKLMDLYIGLPSLFIDSDTNRRRIYGNAGDFRFTNYGFEYRTLGGSLLSSDESILFVFNRTFDAINDFIENKGFIYTNIENDIQKSINTNDLELAFYLINKTNTTNDYLNSVWNFKNSRKTEAFL